jgi:hypothetical protein
MTHEGESTAITDPLSCPGARMSTFNIRAGISSSLFEDTMPSQVPKLTVGETRLSLTDEQNVAFQSCERAKDAYTIGRHLIVLQESFNHDEHAGNAFFTVCTRLGLAKSQAAACIAAFKILCAGARAHK